MNRFPPSPGRDRLPRQAPRPGLDDPSRQGPAAKPPMLPPRTLLAFFAILVVNFLLMRWMFPGPGEPITVPYTVFREEIAAGNVAAIYSRGERIEGRFRSPVTYPQPADSVSAGETSP